MFNDNVDENILKSLLDILNTNHWILAVVLAEAPISPYANETFCVFQLKKTVNYCLRLEVVANISVNICSKLINKITPTSRWIMKRKSHMHKIQYIYIIQI